MSDDYALDDVHRPWFETAQGREKFANAKRFLRIMVYTSGNSPGLRGWDRIRRLESERRCPCCRQVLEHQHRHVLTDAEYSRVDAALTGAYQEFVLAETDYPSLRHVANAYHILDSHFELLQRGLLTGLAATVYNFLALVPRLNGGTVPDRDVQTY